MLIGYTLRNVASRKLEIVPTLVAIALTVAMTTTIVASLESIRGALQASGSSRNAIVLNHNAQHEFEGSVDIPSLARIAVAPGVAQVDGDALVSAEMVSQLSVKRGDGGLDSLTLRGVDPAALIVHPGVTLVRGRWPGQSEPGIAIGVRQLGKHDSITEGGAVLIGRQQWPVLGVFEAPGTRFESELWADRAALMAELRHDTFSVAVVTLESEAAHSRFAEAIAAHAEPALKAIAEVEYYHRAAEGLESYIQAMSVVILILCLGGIFACTSAMYTAFLARMKEFATLIVLGYRPSDIASLVAQEGLLLSTVGGALGLGVAWLFGGRALHMDAAVRAGESTLSFAYDTDLSATAMLTAISVAIIIGIMGSLLPALYALRLPVVRALRD